MQQANPASLYALVFGAVLVAAGIHDFFYNASFESGRDVCLVRGTLSTTSST